MVDSHLKISEGQNDTRKGINYIRLFYFLKVIIITCEKYSYNESLEHKNSLPTCTLKTCLSHNLKNK